MHLKEHIGELTGGVVSICHFMIVPHYDLYDAIFSAVITGGIGGGAGYLMQQGLRFLGKKLKQYNEKGY